MRCLFLLLAFLLACSPAGNRGGRSGSSSFSTARTGLEINYFVDPETGNISEKLSIPKNYGGNLYLAIDRLDEMSDKILYARFRFGYLRDFPREAQATIGVAPGLIPGTTQSVLIISLANRPFNSIPLDYDLFDYNTYNFSSSVVGIEQNNRDKDLYCRGLRIEDDPTSTSGSCENINDKCLYGFAKIEDKGWYDSDNNQYINLINPQVALDGFSTDGIDRYALDSNSRFLTKCLNDEAIQNLFKPADGGQSFVSHGNSFSFSGQPFIYHGPFTGINSFQWEIKSNAIWNSQHGLFQQFLGPVRNIDAGYKSYLFPRFSKLTISSDVEYIASEKAGDPLALQNELDSDGKTYWMSGCNLRVTTKNDDGEHIGSCNVSADIEIFYRENGSETVIASTRWDSISKKVKLQLLQEGDLNSSNGILNADYRTCNSDSACADNECCYNGRCWSDELVSQCDGGSSGSAQPNGAICSNSSGEIVDSMCLSGCCRGPLPGTTENPGILCRPHDPGSGTYCNKPTGSSCILSEMCGRQLITKERLIKFSESPGDCGVKVCKSCEYKICDGASNTCQERTDNNETIDDFDPSNPVCTGASTQSPNWICEGDPSYESVNSCADF